MRNLKISLMVLAMVVYLTLSTIGIAEARSYNNKKNKHTHYSQTYNNDRNYQAKRSNNHYKQYNKHHRVKYVKHHRVKHVKHHRTKYVKRQYRRQHYHNRYLYPALIGAGVGLLVLGMTR